MKKIISLATVFVLLLSFASCGKKAPECTTSLNHIYLKISQTVNMDYEKLTLTKEDLLDYYGIDGNKAEEFVAIQDACGYKDEIVMIKAVDESSANEIASLLNEHISYQKDSMMKYDAAQYEILCSCTVDVTGVFVSMFISSSRDKMIEIYQSYFK